LRALHLTAFEQPGKIPDSVPRFQGVLRMLAIRSWMSWDARLLPDAPTMMETAVISFSTYYTEIRTFSSRMNAVKFPVAIFLIRSMSMALRSARVFSHAAQTCSIGKL
jgi:hypothetical protein